MSQVHLTLILIIIIDSELIISWRNDQVVVVVDDSDSVKADTGMSCRPDRPDISDVETIFYATL